MYKKILAAIDLTPNENAVLDHTRELAHLASATVHLLHIAPLHHIPGEIIGGGRLGVVSGEDDIAPDDRRMIREAVAHVTSAKGVTATGEVLAATEHDIADVILRRARELRAELIVLGETLHRGPSKLFRASVADQVIHHHPPCAVLLVP
jgi:nucleotide-binding universal stress UspA family protein